MVSTSSLTNSKELLKFAHQVLDTFLDRLSIHPSIPREGEINLQREVQLAGQGVVKEKPIKVKKENKLIKVILNAEAVKKVPDTSLKGWLELEVTQFLFRMDKNRRRFNFERQILPLISVSGSGLYFIREMVELLCQSLDRHACTQILLDVGGADDQVDYYFYALNPPKDQKQFNKTFKNHNWTRASHLCRMLVQYVGLSLLAEKQVAYAPSLITQWHSLYGYGREDQAFFEEMAMIVNDRGSFKYSAKLIEIFTTLRDRLLVPNTRAGEVPQPQQLN